MNASRLSQRGFTIFELLVVATLTAIALGIAVPSFRDFMAAQRVKNTAFDFAADLLLARSEAVKRNAVVSLAPAGAGWADGWTVSAGGTTLATKTAVPNVSITPIPDPTPSVAYTGNGRIASTLQFEISAGNTTSVRCVTIRSSGVPNTTTTSCTP